MKSFLSTMITIIRTIVDKTMPSSYNLDCCIITEEEETLWRMFDDEFVDPVRLRCLRVHISDMEIVK